MTHAKTNLMIIEPDNDVQEPLSLSIQGDGNVTIVGGKNAVSGSLKMSNRQLVAVTSLRNNGRVILANNRIVKLVDIDNHGDVDFQRTRTAGGLRINNGGRVTAKDVGTGHF